MTASSVPGPASSGSFAPAVGRIASAVLAGGRSSRMGATTVEVDSGHLAMVSHPGETAQLITAAAEALA